MVEEIKPTSDVPVAEAKAEGQKLEWGPDLGWMSWNDAQVKIVELNAGLSEGEKQWRLPTQEELIAEVKKAGKNPLGFRPNEPYWSSTTYDSHPDGAVRIFMGSGYDSFYGRHHPDTYVRLVRDVA